MFATTPGCPIEAMGRSSAGTGFKIKFLSIIFFAGHQEQTAGLLPKRPALDRRPFQSRDHEERAGLRVHPGRASGHRSLPRPKVIRTLYLLSKSDATLPYNQVSLFLCSTGRQCRRCMRRSSHDARYRRFRFYH